ncbi:protein eva-1-like isoform X2 [Mytilus trossulus]|uniref:protein eva-1-like isoform X2 n=1 Tax=Mytilus trossulus TaxID=6551 RepID=UPI003004DE8C
MTTCGFYCDVVLSISQICKAWSSWNKCLLTSTLNTFDVYACDGETLKIKCPYNTMISIQFSQYGRQVPSTQLCPTESTDSDLWEPENTNCLASTSLRVLFDACQNKQSCQVLASTSTFRQDPCAFTSKYLKVKYKCSPSDFKNITVCENQQINIRCERSQRIAIYSVLFGRATTNTPKCLKNGIGYADCKSATATEEVMKRCHGRNHCVIEAEEYVFGNPCPPGVQKYLSISYTCVPKKILKDRLRHHGKNGFHRKKKRKKKKPDKKETSSSIPEIVTFIEKVLNTEAPVNNNNNMYPADDAQQQDLVRKGELQVNPNKSSKTQEEVEKSNISTVLCINTTIKSTVSQGRNNGAIGLVTDWFNSFNFISKNEEKAILYLVIGVCVGIICLLIVVVIKLIIRNKHQRKSKLDVTDPVHCNPPPPLNHTEVPTMSRTDSVDRIEVVRFEPRGTFRNGERYRPRSMRNLESDDPFDSTIVDHGDPFQRRGTLLSLDQNDRVINNYYG